MNASSESAECASLISTGSFSVFEAVCWPDMGLSVSCSSATPARPGHFKCKLRSGCLALELVPPERDFPTEEGLSETSGRNLRIAGACVALGRAISCKESLAYWRPPNNWNGCGQRNGKMGCERYREETMRAMASSKEAVPSRYGCQNFCSNLK